MRDVYETVDLEGKKQKKNFTSLKRNDATR